MPCLRLVALKIDVMQVSKHGSSRKWLRQTYLSKHTLMGELVTQMARLRAEFIFQASLCIWDCQLVGAFCVLTPSLRDHDF